MTGDIKGDGAALAELESLANTNNGALTPKAVVERAADKKSALHRHFEWNNTKAAEQFRIIQARQIISTYKLVVEDHAPVRYWVNVKTPDHEYRRVTEVLTVDLLRQQHLQRLRLELTRLRVEMDTFEELAGVATAIDALAFV